MPVRAAEQHDLATTFDRVFGLLLRRILPAGELSLTAVSTLRRLEMYGPHRLTDISRLEGVTQPAMTQLVSRLERDGLAQRATDPQDGRVVLVQITEKGRTAMRHRREQRANRLAELMANLTGAERAAIVQALPALEKLTEEKAP